MNEKQHRELESLWENFLSEECDDEKAFSSIYSLCIDDLLSYGKSLGFDEETCRDAVHDVFYNLYTKRGSLKKVRNIMAFLFRSFKNNLLNIRKKYAKIDDLDVGAASFPVEVTVVDSLIGDEERRHIVATIERLLGELTPHQREIVYLRYMQNLPYEEIAVLMNMNVDSVRKLTYRAITRLRQKGNEMSRPLAVVFSVLCVNCC